MMDRLADPERLRSLLDRLEWLWREAGSTRPDSLLPGLSEDEIQEWFGVNGLVPPTEAVVWWGWHADYDRSIGGSLTVPPTGFTFLSLPDAMDTYQWRESDALWIGTPTLFPILEGNAMEVAIHLDVTPGQQSPVRTFMYEDPLRGGRLHRVRKPRTARRTLGVHHGTEPLSYRGWPSPAR